MVGAATTARTWRSTTPAPRSGSTPPNSGARTCSPPTTCPTPRPAGDVFTEITPLETLEQALEILDYDTFRKEQAEAREEGRFLGLGLSVYVEPTSMAGPHVAHRGRHRARRVERARSWRSSAPRRTDRASRPRWRRSSPTRSVSTYDDVTVVQADTQSTPYRPRNRTGSRTANRSRRKFSEKESPI